MSHVEKVKEIVGKTKQVERLRQSEKYLTQGERIERIDCTLHGELSNEMKALLEEKKQQTEKLQKEYEKAVQKSNEIQKIKLPPSAATNDNEMEELQDEINKLQQENEELKQRIKANLIADRVTKFVRLMYRFETNYDHLTNRQRRHSFSSYQDYVHVSFKEYLELYDDYQLSKALSKNNKKLNKSFNKSASKLGCSRIALKASI